ncbi:hypothetical protein EYF80_047783 [Liparis tanakae]|uniref:Uncharacterized protein n=1 Tax=Liparis tanakae TaxID=230148 RepID=A0A4Z2FLA7_9TELE|nr:hypothetical protein EYF80_047783 [Liparis tanakae]
MPSALKNVSSPIDEVIARLRMHSMVLMVMTTASEPSLVQGTWIRSSWMWPLMNSEFKTAKNTSVIHYLFQHIQLQVQLAEHHISSPERQLQASEAYATERSILRADSVYLIAREHIPVSPSRCLSRAWFWSQTRLKVDQRARPSGSGFFLIQPPQANW